MKHSEHLLSIIIYKPQETETADEGTGDDTLSTTALSESASLGCGEGKGKRERERSETSTHL